MISRRDFTQIVGLAAAGATVAGFASTATASADRPTGHTSFRSFNQIDAGVLNIGQLFTGKYSHRVLDGIGHNVPQEAPRQFANAIIEVAGY